MTVTAQWWQWVGRAPGGVQSAAEIGLNASGVRIVPSSAIASFSFGGVPGPFDPSHAIDNNPATLWSSGIGDDPSTFTIDFGTPVTPDQMYMTARDDAAPEQTMTTGDLYYSTVSDAGPWTLRTDWFFSAWSLGETQTFNLPAVTPEITATKAGFEVVFNFPTPEINATKAGFESVVMSDPQINVTKAGFEVVMGGRIGHPAITPWQFVIDDHTFIIFQLQDQTLVYHADANNWYVWGSGDLPLWNVQLGQNWLANVSGITVPISHGSPQVSNVICGDGETNALYFLDPDLNEDYTSAGDAGAKFQRVITGQLVTRSNDFKPLYLVDVTASDGETVVAADMSVSLQISDDRGKTYWDAGERTVIVGDYSPLLRWTSLGSYTSPGRLLKLIDYGALKRVDDWSDDYGG